jgi:hypothetical protein
MTRGMDILSGMPAGRRAVRSLLALGAIVVTIVVLGGCALLAFAAASIDRLQAREERFVVEQALERALDRLDSDVAAAAVWDQAYETIRPGVEMAWMDGEIGSYYANNRGDDLSIVLDSADRPFYAWVDQERATPQSQAEMVAAVAPLVASVRRQERATAASAAADRSEPGDDRRDRPWGRRGGRTDLSGRRLHDHAGKGRPSRAVPSRRLSSSALSGPIATCCRSWPRNSASARPIWRPSHAAARRSPCMVWMAGC